MPSTGATGSQSLAVKGIEELEFDIKESVDPSEGTLDLCWGIIMLGGLRGGGGTR